MVMKQHITLEQLKEIKSDKLVPVIKSGILSEKGNHLIMKPYMAKQLTIGKMIEILKENEGFDIEFRQRSDNSIFWVISFYIGFDEGIPIGRCSTSEELTDALWDAVKELL